MTLLYLDTSALTKLIRGEAETDALTDWIGRNGGARQVITSDLAHTELRHILHRLDSDPAEFEAAARLLSAAAKIRLTTSLLVRAGSLEPKTALRSLDAIHLAAAAGLGAACRWFVTYDSMQAEAARLAGLAVHSPA